MNKKMILTGIVTATVLLGGTSLVGASMNDTKEPVAKHTAQQTEEVVKETNQLISVDEAKEIALSEHDGYVDDIELETDDGYTYYEVDIENGEAEYEIYIDAHTSDVLKAKVDDHDDFDEERKETKARENIITADQAKQIAVEPFGGKVVDLELDEDDGRYEYEVELHTKHGEAEVTIDAVTGDILEQELDD